LVVVGEDLLARPMREDVRSERNTNLPLCGSTSPLEGGKPGMKKIQRKSPKYHTCTSKRLKNLN
jgi:hypothetical protein